MRADDRIRLRHMLDAAHDARSFVAERSRIDLESDRMLVLSLVKAIEIIGEAATQVSDSSNKQLPTIPWADIVGMRNRLVHAYFDVNLEILWRTVEDDLPPLIDVLERELG